MPEYTIEMNQENRPSGDPIELPPLGVIENGKSITVELTREQAEWFAGAAGVKIATDGGKGVKAKSFETQPYDLSDTAPRPELSAPPVDEVVPADAPYTDLGGEQT